MMAKMKMGPKGQVVIPKMFRDDLGMMPGEELIVGNTGREIFIRKPPTNIVEIAEAITRSIAKSGNKVKVTTELLKKLDKEEYEEKYDRIRKQRLSG